jgi:hypothetical protein
MPCVKHRLQEQEEVRRQQPRPDPADLLTRTTGSSYVLSGDPNGEHLRAEVKETEVVLVSHELRLVEYSSNQWIDRVMVSLPIELWHALSDIIRGKGVQPG